MKIYTYRKTLLPALSGSILNFFLLAIFTGAAAYPADALSEWDKLIELASQQNPDLMQAKASLERAHFEYRKSYAAFMPQITASAGYRTGGYDTLSSTVSEEYTLGLSARQSLFAGLKDYGNVKKAGYAVKGAQHAFNETGARVTAELRNAYTRYSYATEFIKLAEKIKDRRKNNVRLVQLRFEGGREHKGSYLLSSASYDFSVYEFEQAKRDLKVAHTEILRVLSGNPEDNLQLTGSLSTGETLIEPDLRQIAKDSPAMRQEEMKVLSAEAGIKIADSTFFPDINLSGGLNRFDNKWYPDRQNWTFGVSVSYPLFVGGQNYYDSKIARKEHERAEFAKTARFNQTVADLQRAWQNVKNTRELLVVNENFVKSATTRARIARAQYTNGLLLFENWDIIESDLINREKALLSVRRDAALAFAEWERLAGKSVFKPAGEKNETVEK